MPVDMFKKVSNGVYKQVENLGNVIINGASSALGSPGQPNSTTSGGHSSAQVHSAYPQQRPYPTTSHTSAPYGHGQQTPQYGAPNPASFGSSIQQEYHAHAQHNASHTAYQQYTQPPPWPGHHQTTSHTPPPNSSHHQRGFHRPPSYSAPYAGVPPHSAEQNTHGFTNASRPSWSNPENPPEANAPLGPSTQAYDPPRPPPQSQNAPYGNGSTSSGRMGERLVLGEDVIQSAISRPQAARIAFGEKAVTESTKGLSRVLRPADPNDIDLFGQQLKDQDRDIIAQDYTTAANGIVVFALSYVQHEPRQGRFKFSDEQWYDLKRALLQLGRTGVERMRLWFDQCLYLRDAGQRSWAHIGILPYSIWPVLSLGTKRSSASDRTTATERRFWPFLEEVAGLWGGGVVTTRELRQWNSPMHDSREWYSYNRRSKLQPEKTLHIVLLNVFHGATDNLQTGWISDVAELREMARLNVLYGSRQHPVIGENWRLRLGARTPNDAPQVLLNLMPKAAPIEEVPNETQSVPVFLDGARSISHTGRWDGIVEFMSGNEAAVEFTPDGRQSLSAEEWHVQTDRDVFRLVCMSEQRQSTFDSVREVWLLAGCRVNAAALAGANPGAAVAATAAACFMYPVVTTGAIAGACAAVLLPNSVAKLKKKVEHGTMRVAFQSSVAWTKVMHGISSCYLRRILRSGKPDRVAAILAEQLVRPCQPCPPVRVDRLEQCVYEKEWQRRYPGRAQAFWRAMNRTR